MEEKYPFLSATELFAARLKYDKNRKPPKPSRERRKNIDIDQHFNYKDLEKTKLINEISEIQWDEALNLGLLIKPKKVPQHFGFTSNGQVFLYPEEVVLIVENEIGIVYFNNLILSLEDCYSIILNDSKKIDEYRIFSYLTRLGFRLKRRKALQTVEDYNLIPSESKESDELSQVAPLIDPEKPVEINQLFSILSQVSPSDDDDLNATNTWPTKYEIIFEVYRFANGKKSSKPDFFLTIVKENEMPSFNDLLFSEYSSGENELIIAVKSTLEFNFYRFKPFTCWNEIPVNWQNV